MMTSKEIRSRFLDFFRDKGHRIVPSDILVQENDPTLLFTGAGMNQFKEQFMGRNITYSRAVSCQKCLRTGDLENVGRTPRHHTFFEMLGNFSFGDYFKKEAVQWAWEFMTREMGIPAGRLWVSVYKDDDEALRLWVDEVGVPAGKVVKLGEHDNFWPADAPSKGPNGPCGPCSEIFYDRGKDKGCGEEGCSPACDCGRFVEVWNLVFTQFERKADGRLDPLPSRNIDTGMGLERMAAVMQGGETNFDTDLFKPIIEEVIRRMPGGGEGASKETLHLISDHVRAVVFAICDGVSPSNEKQGYVVRKLIRRAFLKGGAREPFLYLVVPSVVAVMKDTYPELEEKREHLTAIVMEEERRFSETLSSALPIMREMSAASPEGLSGEQVFKLVDTYGLPLDVIEQEADVPVDQEGFERLMEERKEQSRKGSDIVCDFIFHPDRFEKAPCPDDSPDIPLEAEIVFILKPEGPADGLEEGDCAEIITSPQSSRFYAESGGQAGDTGRVTGNGGRMDVVNTFGSAGRKVLQVVVKKGTFSTGSRVTLDLDAARKERTARNHTATHLLQAALRQVLGAHVKQAGSLVDDRRLRFDFTHMKKLSDREILRVEDTVNSWIKESRKVSKKIKDLEQAREEGALSFFGEKYGEKVRVVSIDGCSRELCGGTHVDNTAEIGVFKVISESSVASGVRRIEALTSETAGDWIKELLGEMRKECRDLSEDPDPGIPEDIDTFTTAILEGGMAVGPDVVHELDSRVLPAYEAKKRELLKKKKKREKEKKTDILSSLRMDLEKAASAPELVDGIPFVSVIEGDTDMGVLRKAASHLERSLSSGVVLIGGSCGEKAFMVCFVTPDLVEKGVNAADMLKRVSGHIDGSGGGKPGFAQSGGKKPAGLPEAFEEARAYLRSVS